MTRDEWPVVKGTTARRRDVYRRAVVVTGDVVDDTRPDDAPRTVKYPVVCPTAEPSARRDRDALPLDKEPPYDQNGHMKTAGVAEVKARLSEYLTAVKAGEEVLVTERGVPVARLTSLPPQTASAAGLEELEKAGLLRRPSRVLSASFRSQRAEDPDGTVMAALVAEREESW